jgi:hypothetical protein
MVGNLAITTWSQSSIEKQLPNCLTVRPITAMGFSYVKRICSTDVKTGERLVTRLTNHVNHFVTVSYNMHY